MGPNGRELGCRVKTSGQECTRGCGGVMKMFGDQEVRKAINTGDIPVPLCGPLTDQVNEGILQNARKGIVPNGGEALAHLNNGGIWTLDDSVKVDGVMKQLTEQNPGITTTVRKILKTKKGKSIPRIPKAHQTMLEGNGLLKDGEIPAMIGTVLRAGLNGGNEWEFPIESVSLFNRDFKRYNGDAPSEQVLFSAGEKI